MILSYHPDVPIACLASDRLHLVVMPTEDCNFRCTYCYEDFDMGRMDPEVVRRVQRLLSRRAPTLRQLHIDWFGGEPLTALDIVTKIMEHARGLSGQHPGLRVASSMTTNAFLLEPDTLKTLVDLGVLDYQITLDGSKASHDRFRLRAGGQGSFDRIWSNLLAAHETDQPFKILLRIHVHDGDLDSTYELLDQIRTSLGTDKRFRVAARRITTAESKDDLTAPLVVAEAHEYASSIGLNVESFESGYAVCYASRSNSLVVRSDGRVGKCTVALYDEQNNLGRILADGTVEIDEMKMLGWVRGLGSGDTAELSCPKIGLVNARNDTDL